MGTRGWGRPYGRSGVPTSSGRADQPLGALLCPECEGTGRVVSEGFSGRGSVTILESPDVWEETCPGCRGGGRLFNEEEESAP